MNPSEYTLKLRSLMFHSKISFKYAELANTIGSVGLGFNLINSTVWILLFKNNFSIFF